MQPPAPIRLLSSDLQNQIAAGEVVERPSSALKELIENSLDAKATRISIQINDGGQSFIRICDNGHGIDENQLELAITRHATSKLSHIHDLQKIHSFGFRGEALPSIASVSRFRIQSALVDGEGAYLEVEYGRIIGSGHVAMPQGTIIEIRDLFSNTPARLKFLKQMTTENRKCTDVVLRFALSSLDVELEFTSSGRDIFHFLPEQSLRQRLCAVWPPQIVQNLHKIQFSENSTSISGLAGDPSTAQSRSDKILIYVNRRPVQDKIILSAIKEAYRGRILGNEFPQAILFLEVPTDEVDINVHPAKTEVRFQNERDIFRNVRTGLIKSLEENSKQIFSGTKTIGLSRPQTNTDSLPRDITTNDFHYTIKPSISSIVNSDQKFSSSKEITELYETQGTSYEVSQAPHKLPDVQYENDIKYLGQIANTYLVLSDGDAIVILDQHAVHERLLYDVIRNNTSQTRQPLLTPLELSLHSSQITHIQDIWQDLKELGFALELTSTLTVMVSAIPSLLTPSNAKSFLSDVLEDKNRNMADLWSVMACKAAIKAGMVLTPSEALSLVDAWRQLPDRYHCPHGRPTAIQWNKRELEKFFKRRT